MGEVIIPPKLGLKSLMDIETAELFEKEALSWIDTPYFHMAKEKGKGADCAMFIAQCLYNVGIIYKVEAYYYSRSWMKTGTDELMVRGFEHHFRNYLNLGYTYAIYQVKGARVEDFDNFEFEKLDILCFTSTGTVVCHHAGIYLGDGKMIHSYQGIGVNIIKILYGWKKRLRYVLRISKIN